ncbi:MAG: hypothetical protein WBP81_08935 [Solirubrobacteraceae bacterium]
MSCGQARAGGSRRLTDDGHRFTFGDRRLGDIEAQIAKLQARLDASLTEKIAYRVVVTGVGFAGMD